VKLARVPGWADFDPMRLLRVVTLIPVVLVLMAGGGALWLYFFVHSLVSDGQSVVESNSLHGEVRVVRDANGIPGILGDHDDDVAFVFGYVMAQDRLWQMDYLRRAGQGRLAEILGQDWLEGDHLIRLARAGSKIDEEVQKWSESERRWVEHFVRGVNRYLVSHDGKLPVEFSLLDYRPRQFTAEDVLSIILAVAWESSVGVRVDGTLTKILGTVGPERAAEVFPGDPAAPKAMISSDLLGWQPQGTLFNGLKAARCLQRVPGLRGGTVWAVGDSRSASGKPLLSSLTYQRLSAPGSWYRARLVSRNFKVTGAFIPGVPVAFVGSNEHVGWGCSSTVVDDADLAIERFDSDEADVYWRIDRKRRVEKFLETYRTPGGDTVSRTIRWTETGPLVSELEKGRALSLRWTGRDGLGVLPTLFGLNRAKDVKQARACLRSLIAPCLHVVLADENGGCCYQLAGRVPIRPRGSNGIVPMPSWTGVHDWVGFIPFDELPAVTNVSSLPAVAADGRPGGRDYPFFTSCYWSDPSRDDRIQTLLGESQIHSRETFQKIQADTQSPFAGKVLPGLFAVLDRDSRTDHSEQQAIGLLKNWDQRMDADSAGAAVFAVVYRGLCEAVFGELLGSELAENYMIHPPLAARSLAKVIEGGTKSVSREASTGLLLKGVRTGIGEGRSLMGDDPAKWRWGSIHKGEFFHPLTRRSRFLQALYHVGPFSLSGSWDTVSCGTWFPVGTSRVAAGVTLRQVTDMTDPPQVFAVSPTGSSAHFFSTHYRDQTRAWLRGRAFAEPTDSSEIRKGGLTSTVFKPPPRTAASLQHE
jgi:penicillin G amidase